MMHSLSVEVLSNKQPQSTLVHKVPYEASLHALDISENLPILMKIPTAGITGKGNGRVMGHRYLVSPVRVMGTIVSLGQCLGDCNCIYHLMCHNLIKVLFAMSLRQGILTM